MTGRKMSRQSFARVTWCCALLTLFIATNGAITRAQGVPHYKVDPSWPKPLPNRWTVGGVGGITVDKDDHIWVLYRPNSITPEEAGAAQDPPTSICCVKAPAVIEFDAEGNVMQAWGGPGWVPDWPAQEHGITIDKDGNVWIGGNGPGGAGAPDRQLLKFSPDGKQLLAEIGHPSMAAQDNADTTLLGGPSQVVFDDAAQEMYIADGYQNKRVVVFDSKTYKFKRGWGAYGIPLSDIDNNLPPNYDPRGPINKNFWGPVHSIVISVDGLVYVGDRQGDRIQVFTKDGKFLKEFWVAPETLEAGGVQAIALSNDPKQKFLVIGGGANNIIWFLDRETGILAGSLGQSGGNAGEFRGLHQLTIDSHGNIYTGETGIKRTQKFVLEK